MHLALVLAAFRIKWIHLFLQTLFMKTVMLFNLVVHMKGIDYWFRTLGSSCVFWAADPLPLGLRVNAKFSSFTAGSQIPSV